MSHDLHLPTDGAPVAAAVVLHPHPEVIDGCDHFLAGAVGRIAARTVAWLTDEI